MHVHILGICGTFMGGVARLAIEKGFKVTGSDQHCYPPMSDQLESLGITLHEGYDAEQLNNNADCVIVGNAMVRGMPVTEKLLSSAQKFRSGPQWLAENILQDKWVIAVAGTHGKTSTASMVAWVLESCGYNPGFLIGGVMENFGCSARLTDSPFFVVEADEYDTAFFDKRSKFIHYRPRTFVINNLEFDHADIFDSLKDIEKQFAHVVRILPQEGLIIRPKMSDAIDRVLEQGCFSPVETISIEGNDANIDETDLTDTAKGADWCAQKITADASQVSIKFKDEIAVKLEWNLIGDHNVHNALAAIAACRHVGVPVSESVTALQSFKNVKRRMELKGVVNDIAVYDDFAHHPTAIRTTVDGLKAKVGQGRILATVDLRSNTMKSGIHSKALTEAVANADCCVFHKPLSINWQFDFEQVSTQTRQSKTMSNADAIAEFLVQSAKPGDSILVMSNGGFDGIHEKLIQGLRVKWNIVE